jgi:hypothetical protein
MAKLDAVSAYLPTVVMWNRLEGRPRTHDFDRAMKAEVRDALWMLSKQWQLGEFIGDDAASPVLARAQLGTTRLTRYRAGAASAEDLKEDVPLEATVERQAMQLVRQGQPVSLDIRLLMGRRWLRQVYALDPALRNAFISKYPIAAVDPNLERDADVCAHSDVWQRFAAVQGRHMDGYALFEYLSADEAHHAYDGIALGLVAPADVDKLALAWVSWFQSLFLSQPKTDNPSWKPEYLEYQFACSAPKAGEEKVLVASEYHHGHLDWYSLDIDNQADKLGSATGGAIVENTISRTFVPSSVTFGGMPHPRWWTFEDWNTNLGFVKPDTQDLNKLLLLDFFVQYSNDWFILPVTLPVGSLTEVRGLLVTDVFGDKIWIDAAGRGSDQDWQRWNMFTLAIAGTEAVPADMNSVLLPVAPKVQQGKALEQVLLIRDEVANMVWGVEARVPVATGVGRSGKDTARELRDKLQALALAGGAPSAPLPPTAAVRYELTNTVPEHWIPFVPAHIEGQQRAVQLQRAALPRILENGPPRPRKVEPRTSLLREGLDDTPKSPYFVHEEEVTRAGVQLERCYQRTRWYDGRVITWIGTRKKQGRGEGRSGLAFDQLVPTKKAE